jgi:hypothetical protein
VLCFALLLVCLQLFVQLGQASSAALLSPSGSSLSLQAGEASRAAASPAFMAGEVLMPAMLDAMVCQVRGGSLDLQGKRAGRQLLGWVVTAGEGSESPAMR